MIIPTVNVKDFSLTLGNTEIVHKLSFQVQPGEVFAFLGANGSGKTSTIRALLGLYEATSGKLHVNGRKYTSNDASSVGYLPEERGLYTRVSAIDNLIYFGEMKGMTRSDARQAGMAFLAEVGLADKANLKLKKLSGGQQQKVQLGVAVLGNPSLLILDEPTKGLDPVNRKLLLDIVEKHREQGASVIYITHLMEEVERLADRVLIIKNGRAEAYGTVKEVKKKFKAVTIEDVFVAIYSDEPLKVGK
ncbi:MAG: ATP-binding cassette domain-containing protein [Candidatus Microsaccharimonas sp.]